MLKTRTSKPPQQQNTTPKGNKAPRPAAAQPRGGFHWQTSRPPNGAGMPALTSQPARPVRFCVFFEQRRKRRSPLLVVAHYQVGSCRSIGRRRARAQRAHHSFDGRSRARRARLAAMRGSVALRVRDHVARRRSPRSARSPSSRSRCRVKIHVSFPSQAATSISS